MSEPLQDFLDLAVEAAYLAGRKTLAYFGAGVAVDLKADQSPVTQADRESEHFLRQKILSVYPDHTFIGEEFGETRGNPDFRWIVDPIDGTKSFIHGIPMYATLIGLEVRGKPTVGVIYLPATDELVAAAVGTGCTWNGRRARVSKVDQLNRALIVTSDQLMCNDRSNQFDRLARKCKYARTWGDAYGYALVATGRAEIMIDAAMNPWDCCAIIPVVSEAGGFCGSWAGETTSYGGDLVGCNRALRETVLEHLGSPRM